MVSWPTSEFFSAPTASVADPLPEISAGGDTRCHLQQTIRRIVTWSRQFDAAVQSGPPLDHVVCQYHGVRTFDFQFIVNAPQEVVREFHHDTAVLRILTPPPTILRVHSMDPLGEGSVSRFTIWAGPLPIRWVATHYHVDRDGFQDVQTEGPMRHWAHTHRFGAEGPDRTRVVEHIEYEHPRFPKLLLTYAIFGPLSLRALFEYRKFQTKRHCER